MANRQYIGARYVPKFDGIHDINKSYEPLTIVTDSGQTTSYTSKKVVPVGIELTNSEYWAITGTLSGAILDLQTRMETVENDIIDINNRNLYSLFEDFGAIGDGEIDDTIAILNCVSYAKEHNLIITSMGKSYKITSDITIDNARFNGNDCSFIGSNKLIILNGGVARHFKMIGGNIEIGTGKNTLQYVLVKDWTGTAINILYGAYEGFIEHIRLENDTKSTTTIGVDMQCNDTTISHIYGYGAHTGIRVTAHNIINDAHLWLNSHNEFSDSKFIEIQGTINVINNCVCDSYQYCFYYDYGYLATEINGCFWINNNTLFHDKDFYVFNAQSNMVYVTGDLLCALRNFDTVNNTLTINADSSMRLTAIDGNFVKGTVLRQSGLQLITEEEVEYDSTSFVEIQNGKLYVDVAIYSGSTAKTQYTINLKDRINGVESARYNGYYYGLATYKDGSSTTIKPCKVSIVNGVMRITNIGGTTVEFWDARVSFVTGHR